MYVMIITSTTDHDVRDEENFKGSLESCSRFGCQLCNEITYHLAGTTAPKRMVDMLAGIVCTTYISCGRLIGLWHVIKVGLRKSTRKAVMTCEARQLNQPDAASYPWTCIMRGSNFELQTPNNKGKQALFWEI